MSEDEPKKRGLMGKLGMGCLGVFAVLFIIGLIGNLMMSDEERAALEAQRERQAASDAIQEAGEAAAEANARLNSAISVSANELWAAFAQNEVAAQRAFGDQPLLISGAISEISLDFMNEPVVSLRTANQFQSVQLDFDEKDSDAIASLRQGQSIRALCTDLSEVIGTPMLDDCELID